MQQMFFIADLIACSTCFGHHYAHHQELETIIKLVAACGLWCLVFKLSVWRGAEGCVSGLRAAALQPYIFSIILCIYKGKGLPQQAELAQGFPGRLRPRIFLTFALRGW
jgi:hypothetical protein